MVNVSPGDTSSYADPSVGRVFRGRSYERALMVRVGAAASLTSRTTGRVYMQLHGSKFTAAASRIRAVSLMLMQNFLSNFIRE